MFIGHDIRLTKIDGWLKKAIITFNAFTIDKKPDTSSEFETYGFAEGAFIRDGYTEYHIVTNKNDWFQSDEMDLVINIINKEKSLYDKIILYGSSMGAFGAINFSHMFDAEFVALAPQFDICPDNIEGDMRWLGESKKIKLTNNYIASGLCRNSKGWLFYDSLSEDNIHAQKIAANTDVTLIDVQYASHLVGDVINDVYGIARIVEEAANGTFSAEKFRNAFEKNKEVSEAYSVKRALYLLQNGTDKEDIQNITVSERLIRNTGLCLNYLRIVILSQGDVEECLNRIMEGKNADNIERYIYAIEILIEYNLFDIANRFADDKRYCHDGKSSRLFYSISVIKFNIGEVDNALDFISKAVALENTKAEYHYYFGELLYAKSEYDSAEKSYIRAIDLDSSVWYYYSRLSSVYCALGKNEQAIQSMRKAIELNPMSIELYKTLIEYFEADRKTKSNRHSPLYKTIRCLFLYGPSHTFKEIKRNFKR